MNPKVDFFFKKTGKWHDEFVELRAIALACNLSEELKWGQPCYTYDGKNVVLIHGFKEYCAFLFFKGALLKDAKGILVQQTENVQAARQIRFTSVGQIVKMKTAVKSYIKEAIDVEKAGEKVSMKKTAEFPVVDEFQKKLDEMPELETAFYELTPGRQRGYLLYFSSAKQSKTREERVRKSIKPILNGKGLED